MPATLDVPVNTDYGLPKEISSETQCAEESNIEILNFAEQPNFPRQSVLTGNHENNNTNRTFIDGTTKPKYRKSSVLGSIDYVNSQMRETSESTLLPNPVTSRPRRDNQTKENPFNPQYSNIFQDTSPPYKPPEIIITKKDLFKKPTEICSPTKSRPLKNAAAARYTLLIFSFSPKYTVWPRGLVHIIRRLPF